MAWENILLKSEVTLERRYKRLREMVDDSYGGGNFIIDLEEDYAKSKGEEDRWKFNFDTKEFARFALPKLQKYLQERGLIYSRTRTGSKDPFNPKLLEYDPKRKTEGKRKYYG